MKTCTGCLREKPLSAFAKRAASVDGLQPKCKDCVKAYCQQQYQKKRAERLANKKKYYEANKDRIIAYNADRYAFKKAAILEKSAEYYRANREQRLAYQKTAGPAQRVKFKARINRHAADYRAAKLRAVPAWARSEKMQEFYYTADMLGMHTGEWYHVDHIVPLQNPLVCGLHCEANLQVLTGPENQSKGNRHWPDMP